MDEKREREREREKGKRKEQSPGIFGNNIGDDAAILR